MAGYRKKMQQWQDAGLISAAQADAIFAWEQDRKSGKFGRGLVGLGVFAILVGILSIIASNWEYIPASMKIGTHLLLNAGVAAVAWHGAKEGKDVIREGAALAFFFLTLTLMVLIGQVFQLDGSLTGLSVTWMVATLPFMAFFGKHYMTGIAWMLSFITTVSIVFFELTDTLPDFWLMAFGVMTATFLPLAVTADGMLKIFQRMKPVWADIFVRTGILFLALNASVATLFWYGSRQSDITYAAQNVELSYTQGYYIFVGIFAAALAAIAAHAALFGFHRDNETRRLATIFAGISVIIMALPFIIPQGESGVMSAVLFIGYWIFIGWIGQQLAWSRLISLAIVLVATRIFGIYVEVFGTLMDTGIGLIVGGAVLLGLITLARRMNKRLTGKEAQHG